MHFEEILSRITGISVPIFGIQWQPTPPAVKVARDIIRQFEDRRVLYRPDAMESSGHCVSSVIEIRQMLTDSMQQIASDSPLYKELQKVRRACRSFCDIVGSEKFDQAPFPVQRSLLSRELTKLRQVTGTSIGAIAIAYGLDVEDELASVISFNHLP